MRLLLDTHIALWAIADDERLSAKSRAVIEDPANDIVVSAASIWEIAIKYALAGGRAAFMPISAQQALAYFSEAGFALLPISAVHAAAVEGLPAYHADPFDRMLLAQAIAEPLTLLTRDASILSYAAPTMAA